MKDKIIYIEHKTSRRKFFKNSVLAGVAIPIFGFKKVNAIGIGDLNHTVKEFLNDQPIRYIDISLESKRHVVIAQGTESLYQGHAHTLLMADGKTMFCVWSLNHGWGEPLMKRSDDAGKTWIEVPIPKNWNYWNTEINRPGSTLGRKGRGWLPMIHRLTDNNGKERLFIFDRGEKDIMIQSVSEDGGKTWSAMQPNGLRCIEPPMNIHQSIDSKKHMMWYSDWRPSIYQAISYDGGITWNNERDVIDTSCVPGVIMIEPGVVRSSDGKQLLMFIRDFNKGIQYNSLFSVSNNEGETWAKPQRLQPPLTGDRHAPLYTLDGRLVVAMRDTLPGSTTSGHFIAWVGTYDDIIAGRNGQYRIKLLHSYSGWDCGYPSLNLLPDGTIIATTYIKYQSGPEKNSVVSTRFNLDELDKNLDKSNM